MTKTSRRLIVSVAIASALIVQITAALPAISTMRTDGPMNAFRRDRCKCQLPANGKPDDVACCKCGLWWIVKRGHTTWQPISKRRVGRLWLDSLAIDLDEYARTGRLAK